MIRNNMPAAASEVVLRRHELSVILSNSELFGYRRRKWRTNKGLVFWLKVKIITMLLFYTELFLLLLAPERAK